VRVEVADDHTKTHRIASKALKGFAGSRVRASLIPVALVASLMLCLQQVQAEETKAQKPRPSLPPEQTTATGSAEKSADLSVYRAPVFKAPARGKPRARVGGGSRSIGGRDVPRPQALVPAQVAHTISEQPSLFWYLDRLPEPDVRIIFTMTHDQSVAPLAEIGLDLPSRGGVQRVELSKLGVHLDTEVEYEWSIAIVPDPDRRSHDIMTGGWLLRVPPPAELASRLDAAGAVGAVHVYADLGLWYDALSAIYDLIEKSPDDARLRSMRDALLKQAGLDSLTAGPR
jgi:hypothetical protein